MLLKEFPEDKSQHKQFPRDFKPNPGGQKKLFSKIPLTEAYKGNTRWILMRGGVNSGKTYCGAAFAVSRVLLDSEARGLITANTYGQLKTSTLVGLAKFCLEYHIKLNPCAESPELTAKAIANAHYCVIENTYVFVLSANIFTGNTINSKETGRGITVRWVWGDELLFADTAAFSTIDSRMGRGSGTMKGIGLITSTINKNNPYNWGWEKFDSPSRDSKVKKLFFSVNCPTKENIYADTDYLESLKISLTPELRKMELDGEYIMTKYNQVFSYFDRQIHLVDNQLLNQNNDNLFSQSEIDLSIDFNHNPACGILGFFHEEKIIIIKEWYLENSDTFKLSEAICQWLIDHNLYTKTINIHGDATGNQQTANSKLTNWKIVWNTLEDFRLNGSRKYSKSNPNILDSVNAVNTAFSNKNLFISRDCIELVKDLEFLSWKNEGIDKSDLMRSHLADALRYLINDIMPYKLRFKMIKQNKPRGIIL